MMGNAAVTDSIYSGSNVLVWGPLGFLGHHLVTELLKKGANVSVLSRARHLYPAPPWANQVSWYELNGLDDRVTLLSAVSSAIIIYNFAGASGAVASNSDPVQSLNANCTAQLAFLMACEQAAHRPQVVFASSWLVYDHSGSEPVPETHMLAPRSMYAAHKLCVENYLRIYQLRDKITYTVCRISNPYGFDPSKATKAYKVLNSFAQSAVSGDPIRIFGDGRQLRDFIYISDLIEALLLCGFLAEARNDVFNIGYGGSHTMLEAVEIISELAGPAPVSFHPWPDEYRTVEPGSYVADISKANLRLGLTPKTDLRTGLEQTIRHLKAVQMSDAGLALHAGAG